MTKDRWDAIERSREPPEQPLPTELENALYRLRENPDFKTFLRETKEMLWRRTSTTEGGLFFLEGQRNLLRNIISSTENARSDRPGRSPE